MFDLTFFTGLLSIIMIDIVLGGDNAVVIAMASRRLPKKKRNQAIFWGTGAAIIVRIGLTFLAVYLLKIPLLHFLGGLLLIWIAYKLLVTHDEHAEVKEGDSLFQAIRTIVVADVIMGLDNVLAIAGAARGNFVLVVLGLLISVPVIIWGSKIILSLIDRFPIITYIGSGILAWTAGTMIVEDRVVYPYLAAIPFVEIVLPVALIVLILGLGKLQNTRVANS